LAKETDRWGGKTLMASKPASSSTLEHYYRVLNTFFNWLLEEGIVVENPLRSVKKPRIKRTMVRAMSTEEVKRLLLWCSGKSKLQVRNRAMVMMLLDTGLRVSEVANLEVSDVDLKTGAILVKRGKGGKERIVRVGAKARRALWRYMVMNRDGESSRLFLTGNWISACWW
jgi:site-specific recombinase XerD